jgi:hypothetical protein
MSRFTMQVGDIWLKDTSSIHEYNVPIHALILEIKPYLYSRTTVTYLHLETGSVESWSLDRIDFPNSAYYKKVA